MKGPFRRIRSPRPPSDPASEVQPPTPDASAPQATVQMETLPAGLPAEDVPPGPSFRNRGRLRRRLRYLRRVRELGFRDLGGLAFDLHRFDRRNDELVIGKLQALDAVDRELRALERALGDYRDIIELREPGIAACPRCGALHGSEARFCPSCGTQFSGPLAIGQIGVPTAPITPAPVAAPPSEPPAAQAATTPVSGALSQAPSVDPPPSAPPPPPASVPPPTPAPAPQPPVVTSPIDEQPTAVEQRVDDEPTTLAPPGPDVAPGP